MKEEKKNFFFDFSRNELYDFVMVFYWVISGHFGGMKGEDLGHFEGKGFFMILGLVNWRNFRLSNPGDWKRRRFYWQNFKKAWSKSQSVVKNSILTKEPPFPTSLFKPLHFSLNFFVIQKKHKIIYDHISSNNIKSVVNKIKFSFLYNQIKKKEK